MLLDQHGKPIEEPKKDIWMPYHEYVLHQYYQGKATKEEYDLALEYHFEMQKREKGIDFKKWLEERNV